MHKTLLITFAGSLALLGTLTAAPTPDQELERLKSEAATTLTADVGEFNSYPKRPKSDGPVGKENVEDFLQQNIPYFLCSDEDFTEVYNYRWWMISKHLRDWKHEESGRNYWVFTEFFGWRLHATRSGAIPCPAGHQFYDCRWLRDPKYLRSYAEYYMGGPASTSDQRDNRTFRAGFMRPESHHFTSWIVQGSEAFLKIHPDDAWRDRMLPHMEQHQKVWDDLFTVKKPGAKTHGFYRILDLYDGNEFTISATLPLIESGGPFAVYDEANWKKYYLGWGAIKRAHQSEWSKQYPDAFSKGYPLMHLVRPSINGYCWGNLDSLSNLYTLKANKSHAPGDQKRSDYYRKRADKLRDKTLELLWDDEDQFFYSWTAADNAHGVTDKKVRVRESVGYTPWYFNMLPQDAKQYDVAWEQFDSEQGFKHNKGMTTAERRSPYYDEGAYAWNGRGWPFQNSMVYKAYANFLKNYAEPAALPEGRERLYHNMRQYVTLHGQQRNIGEHYLPSRSNGFGGVRDYFHSTFPDMVIEDLLGFTGNHGDSFTIQPLLPDDKWDYFYLGQLRYHGHDVDIIWKKDWQPEQPGDQSGLYVWIDGKQAAKGDSLNEGLTVQLPK